MTFLQCFALKNERRAVGDKKKGRERSYPKVLRDILVSEGCIQRDFMEVPHINPVGS